MPLLPWAGRVLDLAAGGGRHAALLRERGHRVVAVDRDTHALARRFAGDPLVEITTLDLEDGGPWRLGQGYDGIVVTNYFHRPLFPAIMEALAPGGAVLYETFMLGNERFGRPSNPDFLLRPGELLQAFGQALTVVAFEQGVVDEPRPAALQRIAAVKGPSTILPATLPPRSS